MSEYTTRLFAQPSWLSGAARSLDLFATFDRYNVSATPEEADAEALRADFLASAEDFRRAFAAVAGE
jgi:hypothetical protein